MNLKLLACVAFVAMLNALEIDAHGMLLVPPARSSAWREDPIRFEPNYDDNRMFCGGVDIQYRVNSKQFGKNDLKRFLFKLCQFIFQDGKCGICGEAYDAPKEYEKGGQYYRGFIVRSYSPGQMITAKVHVK